MINLIDDLALLATVVEAGGFTAASRQNGITKSRLSRRIAELETHLGIQLIDRSSRHFCVTDIGLELSRHGALIRAEADAAVQVAQQTLSEPRGPLRIICPTVLAEIIVKPVIVQFALQFSSVQMTFDTTSGLPETSGERYDIALRATPTDLPSSEIIAKRLLLTPYELVATPDWLDKVGRPLKYRELNGMEGIGWWQVGEAPRWPLFDAGGRKCEISIKPRLITNNLKVAHEAALAGLGMARLPRPLCKHDLDTHRLQRVIPSLSPSAMAIYATYPSHRSLTHAGRMFLDQLTRTLRSWDAAEPATWIENPLLNLP